MKFFQRARSCQIVLVLVLPWLIQASVAAKQQAPMMKIGNEIVDLESGKIFLQAQKYIDSNQFDEAAKLIVQFLASYPKSSTGHYKYGFILLHQDRNVEALKQAKQCTELDPSFFGGWALLGESALNLKQKQQSIDAYKKALAIQSTGENADIIREHLNELTKPEEAEPDDTAAKNIEIARQNNAAMKTNRALSLCDQANDLLKKKEFEQGLQDCHDALKLAPDSEQVKENVVVYLNDFASDCVQHQDLKRAESLMKEAVELQSKGNGNSSSRLTTLKNYAALLRFVGRESEASEIEAQMKAIK